MESEIIELLDSLHLKGMSMAIKNELAWADREASAPAELLLRLLKEESRHRREQSLCYRLEQAKIPWSWSLDTFPFSRQPNVALIIVSAITTCYRTSDSAFRMETV